MSQLVVKAEKVAPGETFEFDVLGSPAILLNDNGNYRAFLNICPHRGGRMILEKENNLLRCQWHNSAWALTGDRLEGPAEEGSCLIPVDLEVKSGYVYAEG